MRTSIEAGPVRVAALQRGKSGSPPVLMVPGYTGSKEDFVPVLRPIAEAGFRVTAIDLPGQYESPGPADPEAYRPDALAVALLDVASALGSRVHLVGHSYGGLVARAAAIHSPERLLSLTLMGSGPAAIGGARLALINQVEPAMDGGDLADVYRRMEAARAAQPGYVPAPDPVAELKRRRFLASEAACLRGMGDAIRVEPDRVPELAATGLPMLVIHGESDDAWPPAIQAEMAVRLGARHAVVAGAAHSPAVENPGATVDALLSFWRSVDIVRDSIRISARSGARGSGCSAG